MAIQFSARPAPLKPMVQSDCYTIHARIVIVFSPNIYWLLLWGRLREPEFCMRRSLLLVASFFVLSSSASDARPSRPSVNVSECNITMPCDFADSQMRRARIASQRRNQQSLAPRAISHRTELAEVNGGRGKVVGGRPAGCPRSFCGCGASIRVFGRIVPGLNLASTGYAISSNCTGSGNGCRAAGARLRSRGTRAR